MNPERKVSRHAAAVPQAVCASCGGGELECFFEIPETPANCVTLRATREAALNCRTARIELVFCIACGAVSNVAFDATCVDYDPSYDNSLHFSPIFQKYADSVARDLVERYDLCGKTIIDIGCGNAEFLSLVCGLGNNRGVGFDPSYIPGRANLEAGQGITIIPDYYSERYTQYAADFVMCRHVLEHIAHPRQFLSNVQQLGENSNAAIFFELPNASFIFQRKSIWDVIYEHCFYYSSGALGRLFSSCGFDVLQVYETFSGQYLCLEARACSGQRQKLNGAGDDLHSMRHDVLQFGDAYRRHCTYWEKMLNHFACQGKRIALWGAGAKGAMFLNAFRNVRSLEYIVDSNPHKCGWYIPGAGQKVVSPDFLKEYRPDVLLIVNPSYHDEISHQLSALGVAPDLFSI